MSVTSTREATATGHKVTTLAGLTKPKDAGVAAAAPTPAHPQTPLSAYERAKAANGSGAEMKAKQHDLSAIRQDIAAILEDKNHDDGSFAPIFIRYPAV
jgi:hypothetical protein